MVGLACLASGCGRPAPAPPSIGTIAREYLRLAVALGERDPDSIDFYAGPPELAADVRAATPTLAAIRASAADLIASLPRARVDAATDVRLRFLAVQLHAIEHRAEMLTLAPSSFDEESRALFGVAPPAVDDARLADVRSRIAALLPGPGALADRYDAFERRLLIPPARLSAVMTKAIDGCRARTLAHEGLPPGEGVTVEYVGNKPWGAFSRYQGGLRSLVQINADFAWTVDRALQVACHETYPGHHAWNVRVDAAFVQRRGWTELSVQPSFSPQSLVTEGGASLAADLAFPGPDLAAFERDVLFPAAGLDPSLAERGAQVERLVDRLSPVEASVARRYLDGELEFERAGAALDAGALMAHPEAALKYINEFRTYVVTYTYGRELAERFVEAAAGPSPSPDARWRAYEQLADPAVMLKIVEAARR